jgi:hypothetical protein
MPDLNAELQRLSDLKDVAEESGRDYKERNAEFKAHQSRCLDTMEAAGCKSWRGETGTLYTRVDDRVKGQVEDRRKYLRYCLEQDEGADVFLRNVETAVLAGDARKVPQLIVDFYDLLIEGLELVAVKEKQDRCNAQARAHIDDEAPLPPGLTFRPDPYIQQRRS